MTPSATSRHGFRTVLAVVAVTLLAALILWSLMVIGENPPPARAPRTILSVSPAIPAGPDDLFEDATAPAGLAGFVHQIADGNLSNIIESVGAGATFLDYDGDGWLDLYMVQGAAQTGITETGVTTPEFSNRLYKNRTDGTFEDITQQAVVGDTGFGISAISADYDNDGDADLYVINVGRNVLYRNRGDGSFDDVTAKAGVGDAGTGVGGTWLDADGDGLLDLFVANYLSFDPDYRHHYGPDAYPGPLAYDAQLNVLYRNRGDGTFEDISKRAGVQVPGHRAMAVAAFDQDEDGDPDIYITNDATPNILLINDGKGNFTDKGTETLCAYSQDGEATSSMAVDVGDCNGDGSMDLLITDTSFGSLYVSSKDGTYDDRVMVTGVAALSGQYVSWGGNFLDMDNDGDLDLFMANGDLHYLIGWEDLLLENTGRGVYRDAATVGGAYFEARLRGRGSAVADYDNDGWTDILVTNLADRPVLLRNTSRGDGHWLTLDLEGTSCNRDGFGALVRVTAGNRTLSAQARCPTGYLSQGDPRLRFGLGKSTVAKRIEIRWPGGRLQTLKDVAADRILHVREPEGSR